MRRLVCLSVVALVGAAILGRVATAETAEDCGNIGGTTRELDQCFNRVYQQADMELNTLYRQLTDKLSDPSERVLLHEAEQVWVQYRDKQCAFETAGSRNGTIHPIEVSNCLTAKTQAHIEELRRQLNCPEGDPSCMHY